jgi:hypothetical protein
MSTTAGSTVGEAGAGRRSLVGHGEALGHGAVGFLAGRITGQHEVDPWGFDDGLAELADPLLRLRWSFDVSGATNVPVVGPALLVANQRIGWSEPLVLAAGIHEATGRRTRVLAAPDLAVVGPVLRRLGCVLHHPQELTGVLRAGEVAGLLLGRQLRRTGHVGTAEVDFLASAVALGVPLVPVALLGREMGRTWRLRIGTPLCLEPRRNPLAVADAADTIRAAVQELADEATPPRWLW